MELNLPNPFGDAFHEFFLITQLSSVEALDGVRLLLALLTADFDVHFAVVHLGLHQLS
ncbi:hypothetical protein RvY_09700, partial [Ramazzottius varieornatus]